MATAVSTGRLTADAYYNSPEIPENTELVHGEVRLMPTGVPAHGWVIWAVFRALDAHVTSRGLGEVFPDQMGYTLPHRHDTVRVPDVSFVSAGRFPVPAPRRGPMCLAPDLAVEVLSESDTHTAMRKKLDDDFEAGVQLVWLVGLDGRGVDVRAPGAALQWVGEPGVLDGGNVVPGFSLPVRDLFVGVAAD